MDEKLADTPDSRARAGIPRRGSSIASHATAADRAVAEACALVAAAERDAEDAARRCKGIAEAAAATCDPAPIIAAAASWRASCVEVVKAARRELAHAKGYKAACLAAACLRACRTVVRRPTRMTRRRTGVRQSRRVVKAAKHTVSTGDPDSSSGDPPGDIPRLRAPRSAVWS